MQCSMPALSPRLSLPAAHEYVRAPADMHPRLVRLTSPNITNTGLNKHIAIRISRRLPALGHLNALHDFFTAVRVEYRHVAAARVRHRHVAWLPCAPVPIAVSTAPPLRCSRRAASARLPPSRRRAHRPANTRSRTAGGTAPVPAGAYPTRPAGRRAGRRQRSLRPPHAYRWLNEGTDRAGPPMRRWRKTLLPIAVTSCDDGAAWPSHPTPVN